MKPLDLSQPDDVLLEGITPTYPRTLVAAGRSNETAIVNRRNEVTYVPARTGPVYRSPMDQISFLITGEQTGGAYFMAEVLVRPGAGNRPHIHSREDETFYMQDGTLTVQALTESTLISVEKRP
jgi:mannose-6-phosphate isomerase-like protein (cupin superfamily)